MCMLWNLSSIPVHCHLPCITFSTCQILDIISDSQHDLIRNQMLFYKIKCQKVQHLFNHNFRLLGIIRAM